MSDESRYDVRVVNHRIRRGEMQTAEINKHLDALPDDAEHGEMTETQFVAAFENRAKTAAAEAASE